MNIGIQQNKSRRLHKHIPVSQMICQQITAIVKIEAYHLANKYAREYISLFDKRNPAFHRKTARNPLVVQVDPGLPSSIYVIMSCTLHFIILYKS